ncbi:fibronectin type III domain-containing protein [Paenibacillus taihuensis]|uniref:fibronectin type III domain-containing protein n=1 Tax=Paenibacillus taihuensis TaxID=1156355 RepID=UPI001FE98B54
MDHKVTATGLKPGTAFSYRAGDGQSGNWSSMGTFKTEERDLNAFTFLYTTTRRTRRSRGIRHTVSN